MLSARLPPASGLVVTILRVVVLMTLIGSASATFTDVQRILCIHKVVWDGLTATAVEAWFSGVPLWPSQETISGWVRLFKATGQVTLEPLHGEVHNVRAALPPAATEYLLRMVGYDAENDLYLDEMRDRVNFLFGLTVSASTISRALLKVGRTRKVRPRPAAPRRGTPTVPNPRPRSKSSGTPASAAFSRWVGSSTTWTGCTSVPAGARGACAAR